MTIYVNFNLFFGVVWDESDCEALLKQNKIRSERESDVTFRIKKYLIFLDPNDLWIFIS